MLRIHRSGLRSALVIVLAVAGIVLGIRTTLGFVVEITIQRDAETKALRWAEDFVIQIPDIVALANGAAPTAEQIAAVDATLSGGDIFRFKVFSPDGTLHFVSDEAAYRAEGGEASNEKATTVYRTRRNNIGIHDGRAKANRPDTYVEAYIPAISPDGRPFGVVEVYVDVSSLAANLSKTFSWLTAGLILLSGLMFLIPACVVIHRNRQLHRRDEELLHLSRYDALTGLLNRGGLGQRLDRAFEERVGTGKPIGLLFFDLDKFKEVNDTNGHDFGDALLSHFAGHLKQAMRPGRDGDFAGRMGGDEFVMALEDPDEKTIFAVAEQILAASRTTFTFNGTSIAPSVSIGVYISPPGEKETQALQSADLALYKAKADGRNRVCSFSSSLEEGLRRRRYVESCVRHGLEQGHFHLVYQPVFDVSHGRMVGFEALLRLTTDSGDEIGPTEFIPVAEESGTITEIGDWVLQTALADATGWPDDLFIAVNISTEQLQTPGIVDRIMARIEAADMPPRRVELEITESVLLDDTQDAAASCLSELRSRGLSLSLDDFGTGFSSLGYLWRYRFDKIKIDRVFLEGYDFAPEKNEEIFETLIILGHKMGFSVTAEGVERQSHLDMLRRHGCDYAQGFLMCHPIPASDVTDLLARTAAGDLRFAGNG